MPKGKIPCGGCGRFKKGDLYTTDQCRFCWLHYHVPEYRALWDDGAAMESVEVHKTDGHGIPVEAKPPMKSTGPGTILKNLLAELGFESSGGCQCNNRMYSMDEWGPKGCEERRQEILGWLKTEYQKQGWGSRLLAIGKSVTSGLAFHLDPLHPLDSLLTEAIRRSSSSP